MSWYMVYDTDNQEPSDATAVDAFDEQTAVEEHAERYDREDCSYPPERDYMVRLADSANKWRRYTVTMEMLPFYSAELSEGQPE